MVEEDLEHLLEAQRARLAVDERDANAAFVVSPSIVFPWDCDDLAAAHQGMFPQALRSDGWSGYPNSLIDLLSFIVNKSIDNVIFLSGDYHLHLAATTTVRAGTKSAVVRSVG